MSVIKLLLDFRLNLSFTSTMQSLIFFAAFAILGVPGLEFTNSIDGATCKKNQIYSDCATACPLTCGKKNLTKEDCPYPCSPGCECEPGFYMNRDLECVELKNCQPKERNRILAVDCGRNQQFSFCRSAYPPTCGKKPISYCPFNCTRGCECLSGYVLNRRKECVEPRNCPQSQFSHIYWLQKYNKLRSNGT